MRQALAAALAVPILWVSTAAFPLMGLMYCLAIVALGGIEHVVPRLTGPWGPLRRDLRPGPCGARCSRGHYATRSRRRSPSAGAATVHRCRLLRWVPSAASGPTRTLQLFIARALGASSDLRGRGARRLELLCIRPWLDRTTSHEPRRPTPDQRPRPAPSRALQLSRHPDACIL